MSFVSKGEKSIKNGQKAGKSKEPRPLNTDGFTAKGQPKNHNELPMKGGSETDSPVSEVAMAKTYHPLKKPGSMMELRYMAKRVIDGNPTATDGDPNTSAGGQDAKHSNSKNKSGLMKGGAGGKLEAMSKKKPKAPADLDGGEDLDDPMDEAAEESNMTTEGMTPQGKKRNPSALRKAKKMETEEGD